ncbi:Putative NADPH-quinone reductase (modulator of drug activity B) [Rhizobium sp. RU20A]|uniref:NAD(P)H-dependent oxidoreductase n=1 Tax=Rhizobium sp. RU20A TaxID=1907412 RepID=UPI0009546FA9|nr:NAD(P)H-dependent oxidoreductase [Rhizobium sp. RU20A]SIQ73688.1 Putative NADPH-quinone reductase (modulator of drug activity B) [Rhizobium sp. RU20A]
MRVLIVLAHPLEDSFAAAVAAEACAALTAGGHMVDLLDLYSEGFDPRLSVGERASYMTPSYRPDGTEELIARLRAADGLILVFPQWWFNLPAILKGFIDRLFVPGVAFDPDPQAGRIRPKLDNIRFFHALTTTGSPWWIVHLYMGNPVRRLLKRGLAAACMKNARFRMLTLHDMDRASAARRAAHLARVRALVSRI